MNFPYIYEPMTAATDLLIAAVSLYAFLRLKRRWTKTNLSECWYLMFFLLMAVSTTFGAILNHAFAYVFPPGNGNFLPNWLSNVLAVSCYAMALIERADSVRRLPPRKALAIAVLVESVVILVLTLWKRDFLFAEIHIAVILYVFSLPLQIRLWRDGYRRENVIAIVATAVMSLIPVVLIGKWHIGNWLIDFDISHILIATAMYLYYRAGLLWRVPNCSVA